jgi:large subunit ribosomal protein L14
MIQTKTILQIMDNSGAKIVQCIKVLGGFKRRYAILGDIIVVSIRRLKSKNKYRSKVKKGEVLRTVITRTKTPVKFKDGSFINFNLNSGVIVNKQGKPLATRVTGPVAKKIKRKGLMKIASLSSGFL